MKLVSVCMIARDEERFIGRALHSVKDMADQIVVVDTGSADRTREIAASFGAEVYEEPWRDDFSWARNVSLVHARSEWVVVLDADEYLDPADARRLRRILRQAPAEVSGFSVHQTNTYLGNRDRLIDRSTTIRAFRNRPWHHYEFPIHEQVVNTLHDGRIEATDIKFWHEGFDPSVTADRDKIARNLRLLADLRAKLPDGHPHAWYVEMQLGVEYTRKGDREEAIAHLAEAAAILDGAVYNPLNRGSVGVILSMLTRSYIQGGRPAEAKTVADRFLACGWNLPNAWFGRGWANVELGNLDEGVRDLMWAGVLSEATEDQEGFTPAEEQLQSWLLAVQALIRRGAPAPAAAVLAQALARRPVEDRLLAMATGLMEAVPTVAQALVDRLPAASVWPLVAKAASENRRLAVGAGARRLSALGSDHAPVAQALAMVACGRLDQAVALLAGVPPESQAAADAKDALARLRSLRSAHESGSGEEVAV